MKFEYYREIIRNLEMGKNLPDSVYVHESTITKLPLELADLVLVTADNYNLDEGSWNILKFFKRDFKIAYLNYPTFEEESYPALETSQIVDFHKKTCRKSDYSNSKNPPILHRKETFVNESYPLRGNFENITKEGERIGLYENTNKIGFRENWLRLIKSKGYYLDENGRIKPLSDKPILQTNQSSFSGEVVRHKTAIARNKLSQPMQALARHNYLTGDYSILDYGCGKGDDVRELEAHGIDVIGWDPTHRPDVKVTECDIVNLGFVLNVIEDRQERNETLINAWKCAKNALIVSVMVASDNIINQFKPYKDGVITSINTFQKYYSQSEIRGYIESTLFETAIAMGQGIFLIFKDKLEEQLFLSERQHIRRDWKQKTQRQLSLKPKSIKKDVIDKHIELFNDYWETTLELGRIPANSEFEFSEQVRRISGSHLKAHESLLKYFGEDVFNESKSKRKEDLIVYFALSMFEKRKPQTNLPESLKRDIKTFFTSYQDALEESREALFSVGNPVTIENACMLAYKSLGCGHIEARHSFTFHRNYLGDLPAVLRIYIGCATQLYGDIDAFQLIKAHITSGKVSLMRYDDWDKDVPLLLERIKIKLRELDIDFFDYSGNFEPQPLINKHTYD